MNRRAFFGRLGALGAAAVVPWRKVAGPTFAVKTAVRFEGLDYRGATLGGATLIAYDSDPSREHIWRAARVRRNRAYDSLRAAMRSPYRGALRPQGGRV